MHRTEVKRNYIATCKFENPAALSQIGRILAHFLQIGIAYLVQV